MQEGQTLGRRTEREREGSNKLTSATRNGKDSFERAGEWSTDFQPSRVRMGFGSALCLECDGGCPGVHEVPSSLSHRSLFSPEAEIITWKTIPDSDQVDDELENGFHLHTHDA